MASWNVGLSAVVGSRHWGWRCGFRSFLFGVEGGSAVPRRKKGRGVW